MMTAMLAAMIARGIPTLTGWSSVPTVVIPTLTGWGSVPTVVIPTLTGWGLTGWGWMPEWGGVFNHLWQSTVFAAVAALLALGLRKNHARARYWLWLAASCKFLVPFSLLVALGTSIGTGIGSGVENVIEKLWPSAPAIVAQPEVTVMFDEISEPFTQMSTPVAVPEHHSMAPEFLFALWACGCAVVLVSWLRRWSRVRAAVRAGTPVHLELSVQPGFATASLCPHPDGWGLSARARAGRRQDRLPHADGGPEYEAGLNAGLPARVPAPHRIRIMSSTALIEPGIFGIFRPVLLLPEGIADRLTPAQLQSILAHELCHVKRRDNLAAAMHMIVEAAFWFHPLVWWIGARLVEERERACDEEVLRSGSEPGVYAESILQVCKFYLESPLKCVAGVTGSDLKKRIESIMSGLPGRNLSRTRKLLLVAASIGAIAGPVIFGVLTSSHVHAQPPSGAAADSRPQFEVASIKQCEPGQTIAGSGVTSPGRLSTGCAPLALEDHTGLIQRAYVRYEGGRYHPFGPQGLLAIEGGPTWLHSEFFAIEAKAATPETPEMMQGPMMQKLLEERFKLKVHRETREGPVYNLTLVKSKLRPFKDGSCTNAPVPGMPRVELKQGDHFCKLFVGLGTTPSIDVEGSTVAEFTSLLNLALDRQVIDKTGLAGRFDIHIDFAPFQSSAGDQTSDRPSIFTAVREQLGLKLEPGRGPNEFLVVDHVEKPSDNFEAPVAAAQASAQPARASDGQALSFEVASIRPSKADGGDRELSNKPGRRLSATNATLKMLIMLAYQVTANELSGGPDWMASDGFDIEAKPENPNATPEQFRQMVQKLLEERFQLKSHFDTKEILIYTLEVGKRGPKLKESKGNEPDVIMRNSYGLMTGVKATMPMFASALSKRVGRQVVDETGLKGAYNFKLEFTPGPDPAGTDERHAPPPGDHPSIFTAVQEQLGLNLKAGKGPVRVLVIDRAEKPTDNSTAPVAKQEGALHAVAGQSGARALTGAPQIAVAAKPQGTSAQVAGPTLRFGAASIKPVSSGGGRADIGGGSLRYTQGMVTGRSVTARRIILDAYHTTAFQLSGGPDWLDSQRFALEGKAESAAGENELRRMLQTLLSERFNLSLHHEKKEMQVYMMTVAKGGIKAPEVKPEVGDTPSTGPADGHAKHMITTSDLDQFAGLISIFPMTGMPVVNKTGLPGRYRFFMGWDEDDDFLPALQREFGLKFEKQRAPMDVLVIDKIEKPSDNFEPPVAEQEHALHTVAPLSAKPQSQPANPAGKPLAFEVATIKPCGSGDSGGGGARGRGGADGNGPSPDRLNLACQPVMLLIRQAYLNFAGGRLNPRDTTPVDGGPAWVNSDRYQITAKAEGTPGMEMMHGPMLQTLLEDRFKLKIRRESREVPAYAMTVARGGPKLKPFEEGSCIPFNGGPLPPPGPDGKLPVLCSMRSIRNPLNGSPSAWQVLGESLDGFAKHLGDDMDRIVINKTGLAGKFDFHFEFTPDESTPQLLGALNAQRKRAEQNGEPVAASDPAGGLSIFTAIQQQLGLKLERSKGAREFLVIERIERPTEN